MSDLSKRIEELEKGMVVLNQVISTSEETEAKLRVRIEALKLGQQAIALTYQQEITALKAAREPEVERLKNADEIMMGNWKRANAHALDLEIRLKSHFEELARRQDKLTKANALIERIELALYAAKDGIDRLLPRYAPKEGVAERPIVVDALAQIAAYRSGG